MINNLLVAFDIGSSKISAAVARVDSLKQMHVIAVTSVESHGIKKSVVIDMEQTQKALKQCVLKLENLIDSPINEAYLSIHGSLCKLVDVEGSVEISGSTAAEEDVENVIKAAKENILSEAGEILWLYPVKYTVDNYYGIKDPVGIRGKQLTLEAKLFLTDPCIIKDMKECMEALNIKVKGIIPEPVALEKLVINDENRNLSTGIINIGAETIDLSIYENDSICYTNHVPLGGNSITKDILSCLSISFAEAEKVKLQHSGYTTNIDKKNLDENNLNENNLNENNIENGSISSMYNGGMIEEIVEARVEELLTFALKEMNSRKNLKDFHCIFITGGGILHYRDIIGRFEEELGKPITPIENHMLGAGSSIYSVPVGMLKVVVDSIRVTKNNHSNPSKDIVKKKEKGIISRLKRIIEDFL